MITEIRIYADALPNGISLVIYRCNDDKEVTVSLLDDGDEPIIPYTFEIDFEQLKIGVKKLEYDIDKLKQE